MINCAIYPRKSKQVDNSDSMDTQVFMCIEYLNNKYGKDNYTVTVYDKDYGITGHSIKPRKDFQRMMRDISDKKIQLVLIQRYDRIARNTRDFCNIFHDMELAGCNLVSVSQQIDTTTPYGKKFMYDQASMAELEWALNSERRKDAIRYAVSIGKCTIPDHSIPMGYKAEYIDKVRRMIKNPEEIPIIEDVFKHYRVYYNYSMCAKMINEKYGKNFTHNHVKRVINGTWYKGMYKDNPNFCEPYISPEEWDELQKKKPVIKYDMAKKTEILFTGMLRCPKCNRRMRAAGKKKKNGNYYRYYHCEYHSTKLCSMNKIKSEVLLEEMLVNYIDKYLNQYNSQIKDDSIKRKKKTDKTDKIDSEIERLNMMFQKGRITEEYYDAEYLRLENEKAVNNAQNDSQEHMQAISEVFSEDWKEIYYNLDTLHRKLFWREVIDRIVLDDNLNVINVVFL